MRFIIKTSALIASMLLGLLAGCALDLQASRPGENLSVKITPSNGVHNVSPIPVPAIEGR
jgi:hypothetical protein